MVDPRTEFARKADVSRETLERLDTYKALLEKWNPAINLVAKSTLADVWTRHFLDSTQVFDLAGVKHGRWVDLGTGGGFPGAICAVLAKEKAPELGFVFLESDKRKSAFLNTVIRDLDLNATVIADRIENAPAQDADILTARALAPLADLLAFADRHLGPGGRCLFQKGANYHQELSEALEFWTFQSEKIGSVTDNSAVILSLGDIRRV